MSNRYLHPASPCKSDSIHWRIDYRITAAGLATLVKIPRVERAEHHPYRWPDHAPAPVTYDA